MDTPLERDAAAIRSQIEQERTAKATALAAAENVVSDEKAKGYNPLGTSADDRAAFERIDAAYKVADTHGENAAELERRLHRMLDQAGGEAVTLADGDPTHPAVARARSLGALVVASKSYKDLLDSGSLGQTEGAVVFPPVQVATREQAQAFLATGRMPVFADVGDGTPLVPSDERLLPPVEIPKRMPTLLDMITVLGTGRDAVTWTKQTSRTNNAATTAFGTALPKSRYQYDVVTSPVIRKGHHAVVDEGNIADQAEFQGIIEGELLTDLRLKVENDALNAAGGGSEWTGILQAGGLGEVDAADADNLADALHMAITTVRVALEQEPTGWGISPEDFEVYYLEKGTDGHYLHHRGPQEASVKTIWGLPAMVSTAYTVPLVAQWKKLATLWVREGISIAVDRIDDQFLEGLWTIRAQTRGAFAVKQPKAGATVANFEPGS